jgi:hypothetical protein
MTTTMTRDLLARLLVHEHHPVIAEHIRAGCDPAHELADADGTGLRKALRTSRYCDAIQRDAKATFERVVSGDIIIEERACLP